MVVRGWAAGLPVEARLIRAAHAAGVPVPEIYWVLTPEDELGDGCLRYLNRLSDALFVMAREENRRQSASDIFWDTKR